MWVYTSKFLHEFAFDGNIVIHWFSHRGGIHLLGRRRSWHGHGQIVGFAQNQAKIFVHERECKVVRILLALHIFQLGFLAGSEYSSLSQHIKQQSFLYTGLLTEYDGFGKSLPPPP